MLFSFSFFYFIFGDEDKICSCALTCTVLFPSFCPRIVMKCYTQSHNLILIFVLLLIQLNIGKGKTRRFSTLIGIFSGKFTSN